MRRNEKWGEIIRFRKKFDDLLINKSIKSMWWDHASIMFLMKKKLVQTSKLHLVGRIAGKFLWLKKFMLDE